MQATVTVRFTDVVSQMSETAKILGTNVEDELYDTAPSLLASKASDIALEVPEGHENWCDDLEHALRAAVESMRTVTGAPCRLTVCMI